MNEQPKRNLRVRSRVNFMISEDQDIHLGNTHHQYTHYVIIDLIKKTRVSPFELNANAKKLVKFINNINKAILSHRNLRISLGSRVGNNNESKKSVMSDSKKSKDIMLKSSVFNRSNASRKNECDPLEMNGNLETELKQLRQNHQLLNYSGNSLKCFPQLKDLLLDKTNQNCHQKLYQNLTDESNYLLTKIQKKQLKKQKKYQKYSFHKIFSRSTYHIAIAYKIYAIQQKSVSHSQKCNDPTLKAKKLRKQQYQC